MLCNILLGTSYWWWSVTGAYVWRYASYLWTTPKYEHTPHCRPALWIVFYFLIFCFILCELIFIVFCIWLLFMDYHSVYIIYEFLVIFFLNPCTSGNEKYPSLLATKENIKTTITRIGYLIPGQHEIVGQNPFFKPVFIYWKGVKTPQL